MNEQYRKFIRQLVADILNEKKDYSQIGNSARDFFYVQYTLLKMGEVARVKEMGLLARERNLKGGDDIHKPSPASGQTSF